MDVVILFFLVALSPLIYGRLIRPRTRGTVAPPAPRDHAPRDMIQLTLTQTEARLFRALIVLGSRAMWPHHVGRGREGVLRKELEQLTRSVPQEKLLDTASFYWAQLSSWLRDRAPAVEKTPDREHA